MSEVAATDPFKVAARLLSEEIDTFNPAIAAHVEGDTIGRPLSAEWHEQKCHELNKARVEPHWINVAVRDTYHDIVENAYKINKMVGVTKEEGGYKLAFDPARSEFVLIQKYRDNGWASLNIRGGAIDCYSAM